MCDFIYFFLYRRIEFAWIMPRILLSVLYMLSTITIYIDAFGTVRVDDVKNRGDG